MSKAVLIFAQGTPAQRYVDIPQNKPRLCIGRKDELGGDEGPDIVLKGSHTSRKHAELRVEQDRIQIRDKSSNGTWKNGYRMEKSNCWTSLNAGDTVRFGSDPRAASSTATGTAESDDVASTIYDIALLKVMSIPRGGSTGSIPNGLSSVDGCSSEAAPSAVSADAAPPRPVVGPVPPSAAKPAAAVGVKCPDGTVLATASAAKHGAVEQRRNSVPSAVASTASTHQHNTRHHQQNQRPVNGPVAGPQLPPSQDAARGTKRAHEVNGASGNIGPVVGPQLPSSHAVHKEDPYRAAKKQREAPAPAPEANGKPAKCDKCDGPHATDSCPHFKGKRDDHKDAWVNYNRKHPLSMGKSGGRLVLRNARTVRQPGDGSCLFHSLCFGLNGGRNNYGGQSAQQLRKSLANFIASHPQLEISGDTLEEWIKWDAQTSVRNYTSRMAIGGWGGGIEMAACSIQNKVNVHVYEAKRGGYERISCFDCPQPTNKTIHVLYQGGMHFDAMVVN